MSEPDDVKTTIDGLRARIAALDAALATEKAYSVGVEMAWQGTDVDSYREWLASANDVKP